MSLVVVCICAFSSKYFCLDRLGKAVILLILFVLSSVGASDAPIMWLCIPARTRLDTFSQQSSKFSKFFKNICTALLQVAVHSTMVSLTSARDCPMPYGNSIVVASSGNAIFPCCAIWQRHACNAFGIAISIVMQHTLYSGVRLLSICSHEGNTSVQGLADRQALHRWLHQRHRCSSIVQPRVQTPSHTVPDHGA